MPLTPGSRVRPSPSPTVPRPTPRALLPGREGHGRELVRGAAVPVVLLHLWPHALAGSLQIQSQLAGIDPDHLAILHPNLAVDDRRVEVLCLRRVDDVLDRI